MITAKQWKEKYPMAFDDYCAGVVEEIQLDAFRAGMEFAAKVKVPFPKLNHPLSVELFEEGLNYKTNAILTTAQQLTEIPR